MFRRLKQKISEEQQLQQALGATQVLRLPLAPCADAGSAAQRRGGSSVTVDL